MGWGVEVTNRQVIIDNTLRSAEKSNTDKGFSQGFGHPNVYVTNVDVKISNRCDNVVGRHISNLSLNTRYVINQLIRLK